MGHCIGSRNQRVPVQHGARGAFVPLHLFQPVPGRLAVANVVIVRVVGIAQHLHHIPHREHGFVLRAEIPCLTEHLRLLPQLLAKAQIARQNIQHILPRLGCIGVADGKGLAGLHGADAIGDQAILGPVAAAHHIAAAAHGNALALRQQKGTAIGSDENFRCRLAVAVGVKPAQQLVGAALAVGRLLGAAIGGNKNTAAAFGRGANACQHIQGADHIDGIGFVGAFIAKAHQRLCRQMKHHLGLVGGKNFQNTAFIANIGALQCDFFCKTCCGKHAVRAAGAAGRAHHPGPHGTQPQAQPCAFKAGAAGDQSGFIFPECRIDHVLFLKKKSCWGRCHGSAHV